MFSSPGTVSGVSSPSEINSDTLSFTLKWRHVQPSATCMVLSSHWGDPSWGAMTHWNGKQLCIPKPNTLPGTEQVLINILLSMQHPVVFSSITKALPFLWPSEKQSTSASFSLFHSLTSLILAQVVFSGAPGVPKRCICNQGSSWLPLVQIWITSLGFCVDRCLPEPPNAARLSI